MPPQPWTREEVNARKLVSDMREQRGVGNLSMGEFSGALQEKFGWNEKTASRYAVNVARSEGGPGARFLQRAGVTGRAKKKYAEHRF